MQPQSLHQRYQQRFDELAMTDVAQTPDEEGQLCKNISVNECVTELLKEIRLPAIRPQGRRKDHFCHRSQLLSCCRGLYSKQDAAFCLTIKSGHTAFCRVPAGKTKAYCATGAVIPATVSSISC